MIYKKVGSKLDINKKDFFNEIKKSKEADELTPTAIKYFIQMANHGVRHGKLYYQDKRDEEDCIQAALYDVLKHWRNFDETKFSDPFSFFSSVIFNGYANQFKMIHRHRFIKNSRTSMIDVNTDFNIDVIKKEVLEFYNDTCEEIHDRDIKRIQVRLYSGNVIGKWFTIKIDNIDAISELKDQFPHIDSIEIKIDFNGSVNFIALDQSSNDSEIFNI